MADAKTCVGFEFTSVFPSPKFQLLLVIDTPELFVVLFVKANEFPLRHCVAVFISKLTTGAGLFETVTFKLVVFEDPQLLFAFTVTTPPKVFAVIFIALKVDVPTQLRGIVHV